MNENEKRFYLLRVNILQFIIEILYALHINVNIVIKYIHQNIKILPIVLQSVSHMEEKYSI
jgi:hypothetical protein